MPIALQSLAGPLPTVRQAGAAVNPAGTFGEALTSRGCADYYPLVKAGLVFTSGGSPYALSGGDMTSSTEPLLGVWNPPGSGVDLVMLSSRIAMRTTGGTGSFFLRIAYWMAQAQTLIPVYQPYYGPFPPINLRSMTAEGAGAAYFTVGLLAPAAGWMLMPSVGICAMPTIANRFAMLVEDLKGMITVPPGFGFGIGCNVTGCDASAMLALTWAEIPV